MTAIAVKGFSGLIPRTAVRLLNDRNAQVADNVDLLSGDIRALRNLSLAHTPAGSGPWLSVYRAESSGTEKWLSWLVDVDAAQMPLSTDVEQRYLWTGDGEPKYATFSNLNSTTWSLGIPNPVSTPSVSPSGGTGAADTRAYCYTFVSALGEESGPSPVSTLATGKIDDTWAITGMDTTPLNSGTGTATYSAPNTTFTNAASAKHWLRVGDQVVISGTTLEVLSIPTVSSFTVSGDYSAAVAWARAADWNIVGMTKRIYRTSGTTSTFQLVVDALTAATTSYNDTILDANIPGDELLSTTWAPPPAGMRGVGVLPSGAAFGFVGSLLCFSEPFQLHAWPSDYQLGAAFDIVATASYGTVIVVATLGVPYYADGTDPSLAVLQKVDNAWPCLSKRSIVSVGDGVLFATAVGMVYIGLSGSSIFTSSFYTPKDWTALNPDTMVSAAGQSKVLVSYLPGSDATRETLVFYPSEEAKLTTLSLQHDELYADPRNGLLYFVDSGGVEAFDDAAGARLSYSWKSKDFFFPQPTNFGAVRIDLSSSLSADDITAAEAAFAAAVASNAILVAAYKGAGALNGSGAGLNETILNGSNLLSVSLDNVDYLTFSFYSRDVLVMSKTITQTTTFRLPSGFRSDTVSFSLNGTPQVHSVKIGETPSSLRTL